MGKNFLELSDQSLSHHLTDRATEKLTALKNQIHHRDPGDARNLIFKSVLSSMVDLNFCLMPRLRGNVLVAFPRLRKTAPGFPDFKKEL